MRKIVYTVEHCTDNYSYSSNPRKQPHEPNSTGWIVSVHHTREAAETAKSRHADTSPLVQCHVYKRTREMFSLGLCKHPKHR